MTKHFFRRLQLQIGQFSSVHDARQFFLPFVVRKCSHLGVGFSVHGTLFDQKMMIGLRRDLGQVGDTDDLPMIGGLV